MTFVHPQLANASRRSPTAVIISDVLLHREGVAGGLQRLGDFELMAAIGSAQSEALFAHSCPDVVLIDASRQSTVDLSRMIARVAPAARIVGFGINGHDEAIACAEAGITAFVGHEGTIEDLNETALRALKGETLCSPELTAKLVRRLAMLAVISETVTVPSLTRREIEIAHLVDGGLSNKEIAGSLRISPATVKNHVHTILDKLDLQRRSSIGRKLRLAEA